MDVFKGSDYLRNGVMERNVKNYNKGSVRKCVHCLLYRYKKTALIAIVSWKFSPRD